MQSQSGYSETGYLERFKQIAESKWDALSERQKTYAKKAWGVMTYKWRWQIAMNVPYLVIFLLDRTFPAVHQFDMALIATITSKLPIPAFISTWMGLGQYLPDEAPINRKMIDNNTLEQCKQNKNILQIKIDNIEHAIKESEAIISE